MLMNKRRQKQVWSLSQHPGLESYEYDTSEKGKRITVALEEETKSMKNEFLEQTIK